MRTTFSKVILLVILFSQVVVYGQNVSGTGSVSDPVTVDFATATIVSGSTFPGYNSSITVDERHKLQIYCAKNQNGQISLAPCIKNADGALVLGNSSMLPFQSNSGAIYFDPPAVSLSGVITGEIGSSSISPQNILQVAIDNITLLLKNNPPRVFSYPFAYNAPGGINLFQLSGFFTQTITGIVGDPNGFYKVGLKTLTWSTKQANITLKKVDLSPSQRTANEKYAVKPDEDININLTITATDLKPQDDREATVELRFLNTDEILSQVVPVSAFSVSGGHIVNFKKRFTADDVGEIFYTATVRIGEDQDFLDNDKDGSFYVYCNVEDKGTQVPYFSQGRPGIWADDPYANRKATDFQATMGFLGCNTTSVAMLMSAYGIKTAIDGSAINPRSVNNGLRADDFYKVLGPEYREFNGYTKKGNDVHPMGVINFARASYMTSCLASGVSQTVCIKKSNEKISYIKPYDINIMKPADDPNNFLAVKEVNKNLCAGNPVILKVKSESARRRNDPNAFHFVLAKGTTVDVNGVFQFITNDPIASNGENYLIAIEKFRGYRLYKQIADPSMIYLALTGGAYLVVTDPLDKKTGYNPVTQQFFEDGGSDSSYSLPGYIDSQEADITTELESNYTNVNAPSGEYTVEIFAAPGAASTDYNLIKYSYDINGNINGISETSGTVIAGESVIKKVVHSQNILPIKYVDLKITKALFFDSVRKDKAIVIGKIITDDSLNKSVLKESINVEIGSYSKSIKINKLKKIKDHKNLYYTYVDWGRRGLVFQININTGDFIIYIDNIDLDDAKPSLTANITLKIDDLVARGVVTFKDVKRRKNDR